MGSLVPAGTGPSGIPVGQTVGYVADCAVPDSTNDKINLLRDGLPGHSSAWILDQ